MRKEVIQRLTDITATGSTTSNAISLEGVRKVTIIVKRSNHTSGSSAFSVTVSADGTNYVTYNRLISNVTNTNGQNITRVASVTLSSNTTECISLSLEDTFLYMKISVNNTTDGTANAWVILEK